MTKSEQRIIEHVRQANALKVLCGLGVSPSDSGYRNHDFRFVRRLHESGAIVWVDWTPKHGAGWALKENIPKFS